MRKEKDFRKRTIKRIVRQPPAIHIHIVKIGLISLMQTLRMVANTIERL